MAAGAGTRLRPLTAAVPKPMVPVANRPVLEYTLENLRRHGVTDVILNLHAHPQLIRDHFRDGSSWGMTLAYSVEPKLMGTAGGVKKAEAFLRGGTFLVMSGDGLTDANLTDLLAFHFRQRSVATMGLKAIDTRFDYGVTLTAPDGRIERFVEKPKWGDLFSNQVNTGIYVFEPAVFDHIPPHEVYDFGNQLWPALLRSRWPIFGYALGDYWCDVGNLNEYRRAQRDMLDGKIRIPFPGQPIRPGIWVDQGTVIERGATLEAPCLIGRDCRIARDAVIGAYTVVGARAQIGAGSRLRNSILWDDVRVDRRVTLDNCIIGHKTHVKQDISVYEGTVINIAE
jgi:mannose-1-phosphate guanylyltransferase/phosphomannomutase